MYPFPRNFIKNVVYVKTRRTIQVNTNWNNSFWISGLWPWIWPAFIQRDNDKLTCLTRVLAKITVFFFWILTYPWNMLLLYFWAALCENYFFLNIFNCFFFTLRFKICIELLPFNTLFYFSFNFESLLSQLVIKLRKTHITLLKHILVKLLLTATFKKLRYALC